MRTMPLLVRISAIIIPCAHVLMVISLFFLYFPFQASVCAGWQWFVCPFGLGPLALYSNVRFVSLIVALALPPLASVAVWRSPSRMMGLLGLWTSLPLTLFYSFVWESTAIVFHIQQISVSPVVWFLPIGFALSFLSCLALALYLPFLRTGTQERRAMRRLAHLEAGQHEGAERVSHPDGGSPAASLTRGSLQPSLAFFGLLCHLLIGLNLSFPYTELHDGYEGTITPTTGWQLLGNALQSQSILSYGVLLLLAAVVLPALFYLACLLPFPRKSEHREALPFKGAYLSYLLNTMGFSLSLTALALSLSFGSFGGADLHNYSSTDVAFAIPPAPFLLSLLCSTVLLNSRLQQPQAGEVRS
jgi:hypothetical protein